MSGSSIALALIATYAAIVTHILWRERREWRIWKEAHERERRQQQLLATHKNVYGRLVRRLLAVAMKDNEIRGVNVVPLGPGMSDDQPYEILIRWKNEFVGMHGLLRVSLVGQSIVIEKLDWIPAGLMTSFVFTLTEADVVRCIESLEAFVVGYRAEMGERELIKIA